MGSVFQRLQFLSISLCVDITFGDYSGFMPKITSFIAAAPALEALHLRFDPVQDGKVLKSDYFYDEGMVCPGPAISVDISMLLATLTSPALRMLSIQSCNVTASSFLGYMQRHESLKDLSLNSVNVIGPRPKDDNEGEWRRLVEQIAPNMLLDTIHLYMLYDTVIFSHMGAHGTHDYNKYIKSIQRYFHQQGQNQISEVR